LTHQHSQRQKKINKKDSEEAQAAIREENEKIRAEREIVVEKIAE